VFTWLDDLARIDLDQKLAVVKVGNHKLAARQGSCKADSLLHNQVTLLAGEHSCKQQSCVKVSAETTATIKKE